MTNPNNKHQIGPYIKANVIPNGMTVKKAADALGVGRPALSNLLNGKASLSGDMAAKLEAAFGHDKSALLAKQQEFEEETLMKKAATVVVKSYTPSFLKIRADHIEAWADKNIEARASLAAFLRKLATSTGSILTSSNFPAYNNSQTHGWDGYTASENSTPWITEGISGWEFGCNENPKAKANDDYDARKKTKEISPEEKKEITFVFVTPRRWKEKDNWAKEKNKEGIWKDVQAYDSNDLEQWMEHSIPTQIWFGELLGVDTGGFLSPEAYFDSWSSIGDTPISGKIFNGLITAHHEDLSNWLSKPCSKPYVVSASSREEAGAFIAQAFTQSEKLNPFEARVVFVESKADIRKLHYQTSDIIPVVTSPDLEAELSATFKGKHCIIASEKNIRGFDPDLILESPEYESFNAALKEMGFKEAQITVQKNNCGKSPTILRRQIATIPDLKQPIWAKDSSRVIRLLPYILASSWKANQAGDQEILQILSDKGLDEIEKDIAELTNFSDAPIWSEGNYRGVVSKLEALNVAAPYITKKHLDDFFLIAVHILSEDDPALDLDESERWYANIYKKVREHSGAIREAVCDTLILFSIYGNGLFGHRLAYDVQAHVSNCITVLLRDKTPRNWEAQKDKLPRYAEAAPHTFLEIVEDEIKSQEPFFLTLFRNAQSDIFGSCPRTGMLWALELLAWDASLLPRVCNVLGYLSEIELNDNWTNKPQNSLKDILLSWRPHTSASLAQRCEVVSLLFNRYPNIGWKFSKRELSFGNDHSSGTSKPRWRGDVTYSCPSVTNKDVYDFRIHCLNLMLNQDSYSHSQISDLIDCIYNIPEKDITKIISIVKRWMATKPEDKVVSELKEKVRQNYKIRKRRKNKADERDLSEYAIELHDLLEPDSLIYKYHWLFAKHWVEWSRDEIESDDDLDHKERDERIEEKRINAIQDVRRKLGDGGLIQLVKMGDAGFPIGFILVQNIFDKHELSEFVTKFLLDDGHENHPSIRECLSGCLFKAYQNFGADYFEGFINTLNSNTLRSNYLLHSPKVMDIWLILEKQDNEVQHSYWSKVTPRTLDRSSDELEYYTDKMIKAGRPKSAFSLIHLYPDQVESETLVQLLKEVATVPLTDNDNYSISEYEIERCLNSLNSRGEVSSLDMAQLEFLYIEAFHSDSSYKLPNLSHEVAKSPLLYAQMLAYCYKRSDDKHDPEDWNIPKESKQKNILAQRAYSFLDNMSVIPGTEKDGKINSDGLFNWITEVRRISHEQARSDISDQQIGQLLAKCPIGDDGIWPHEAIREPFEKIASNEVSIGMQIGKCNLRGAHWRGPDGAQERELAAEYKGYADSLSTQYPFVGRMLMNISNSYLKDAEWEDTEGRIRKRIHE